MSTYVEAEDEIYGVFYGAIEGTALENNCALPNRGRTQSKGSKKPWVYAAVNFVSGEQAAFETGGVKLYNRSGLFMARIHAPASKDGSTVALELATVVANAFEAVTANNVVWYSNVRLNNIGVDGGYYVVNVLADFFFQQVK